MTFKTDFDKAVRNINKKSDMAIRAIGLQLFGAIIKDTPVDTGRLRGNWQTTIGQPASGSFPDSKDKNGSVAGASMRARIAQYKVGQKLFLTNNLPYAQAIEDGHSKQRPYGMVKTNVAIFKAIVARTARGIKIS